LISEQAIELFKGKNAVFAGKVWRAQSEKESKGRASWEVRCHAIGCEERRASGTISSKPVKVTSFGIVPLSIRLFLGSKTRLLAL